MIKSFKNKNCLSIQRNIPDVHILFYLMSKKLVSFRSYRQSPPTSWKRNLAANKNSLSSGAKAFLPLTAERRTSAGGTSGTATQTMAFPPQPPFYNPVRTHHWRNRMSVLAECSLGLIHHKEILCILSFVVISVTKYVMTNIDLIVTNVFIHEKEIQSNNFYNSIWVLYICVFCFVL